MVRRGYSKFRARKVLVDGITFDSQREGLRYLELKTIQDQGKISELELQPKFRCIVNEKKICDYFADFRYYDHDSSVFIQEDVKSEYTSKNPIYRLKKKLVEALHDVVITEIK